jgi:hypothetical protein
MCPTSRTTRRTRERTLRTVDKRRLVAYVVLALGFLLGGAPLAAAQPEDWRPVPPELSYYVVDSVEWQQSPWMTSQACADKGGDFSVYTKHMIRDLPALLAHWQPDFAGRDAGEPPRRELLLQGFRAIATDITIPDRYCVDAVRSWTKPNTGFRPFGFEWGVPDDPDRKIPGYGCADGTKPAQDRIGACRGFYLSCAGATLKPDKQRCQRWNTFADEYSSRMTAVIKDAYQKHPALSKACEDFWDESCPIQTEVMSPGEIAEKFLNWVAKEGMEQLVSFVVSGVTKLWDVFASIAGDAEETGPSRAYPSANADTTGPSNPLLPDLTGRGFTDIYNLVAGVALALGFLLWLGTVATGWRRGHLQYSAFGAIKGIAGVTLAAVGAVLMLQLAGECTAALLAAGGGIEQKDFTDSLMRANPLVALLAGLVMAVCLVFGIIFLTVHGALVLCWALFGSVAAIGQVNPASADWLPRWASRGTAFVWSPFAMIAVMLLAKNLFLPVAADDESSHVINVVLGTVMVALMVLSPYLLWELIDFVSGRAGAGASGGTATQWAGRGATRAAQAARTAGGRAVGSMLTAGAEVMRHRQQPTPAAAAGTAGTGRSSTGGKPAMTTPAPASDAASTATTATSSGRPGTGRPATTTRAGASTPRPAANRGRVVAGTRSRPTPPPAATGTPATPSTPPTPPRPVPATPPRPTQQPPQPPKPPKPPARQRPSTQGGE